MKPIASAPLVLAFLVAPADVDGPAVGVAPGDVVSKCFVTNGELELHDVKFRLGGFDMERRPVDVEEGWIRYEETFVVRDTYEVVGDGAVCALVREYLPQGTKATSRGRFEIEADQDPVLHKLAWAIGRLRFVRAAPDATWERALPDGSEPAESVSPLTADLDWWSLLPSVDETVEPGDAWYVPATRLDGLLAPGRAFDAVLAHLAGLDVASFPDETVRRLERFLDGLLLTCRHDGNEELDGTTFARIELSCQLDEDFEFPELGERWFVPVDEDAEPEDPSMYSLESAKARITGVAGGVLLWNLDAGRFERLDLLVSLELDWQADVLLSIPAWEWETMLEISGVLDVEIERTDAVLETGRDDEG